MGANAPRVKFSLGNPFCRGKVHEGKLQSMRDKWDRI